MIIGAARRKEAGGTVVAMVGIFVAGLVDWFVPPALRMDPEIRRPARLFVIGHFCGTPVGGLLVAYIRAVDPTAGGRIWLLAGGVASFLLYPLALRLTGWLELLALVSIEHLILVILFGAYHYGGAASPFLPWLVPIPIIAVLHFGPRRALRTMVLGALAAQLFGFFLIDAVGPGFPTHISGASLAAPGIFSVLGAITYVALMALYYMETIVEQQAELRHEVLSRRQTEKIDRIMMPFEQGGQTTERATGGTGLGLPLARELAMRHGGTLALESEPGKGTTATVTFPPERVVATTRTENARQYPLRSA